VRYDAIAQAMGCHGEYADSIDTLVPALQRAAAAGKPAVVHAQVDAALNTTPPGFEEFRKARSVQGY
jgi:thiamine pyrophosphate-dependent acetolactate synthase large subunit-like protein